MIMLPQQQNAGETQGPALMVLAIFLPILTSFFLVIRFYTRIKIIQRLGHDDWLALVSYILAVALSGMIIVAHQQYGTGKHLWEVPKDTLVPHRRNIWISQIIYAVSSTAIKVSVLAFYMNLAAKSTRLFQWASYAALLINIIFMGLFIIWLSVLCQPLSRYWNQFDPVWRSQHPNSQCYSEDVVLPTFAFFSALLDLVATLIPLLLLRKMEGTFREKLLIYPLFAFGFLVFIFGIIRADTVLDTVKHFTDYTWLLWECWVWTLLELYTGIMAACVPAIKPFFAKLYRHKRSKTAFQISAPILQPQLPPKTSPPITNSSPDSSDTSFSGASNRSSTVQNGVKNSHVGPVTGHADTFQAQSTHMPP